MSNKTEIQVDICIIGGGPAGSVIAYQLVSLGFKVCLLEAKKFPRPQVGMSLTPAVLSLLETIKARELIENADFFSVKESLVWWAEQKPRVRQQQGEGEAKGLHVDRGKFDQLLLTHAEQQGVNVLQPARANKPEKQQDGRWKTGIHTAGNINAIVSDFIVDASGGRSLLKQKKIQLAPRLFTLYAYWNTPETLTIDGAIEASRNRWFWFARVNASKSLAAVFIDPQDLAKHPKKSLQEIYLHSLRDFRLFEKGLAGTLCSKVQACDATSRCIEHPVGADYINIGNASFSVDPLSSQGVQQAIVSALQAAVVINTILRHPENKSDAIAFYQERHQEKIQRYTTKTADFYAEMLAVYDTKFWQKRSSKQASKQITYTPQSPAEDNCKIALAKTAIIQKMPVMEGNKIVSKLALHHESLERPVSYVGDVEIVPLLQQIQSGQMLYSVIQNWSKSIPLPLSFEIVEWLWKRGIIEAEK